MTIAPVCVFSTLRLPISSTLDRFAALLANPLSLPAAPPGVSGIFGAQFVAIDAETGALTGASIGGWSCANTGPVQFDGSYEHSYLVYAEPLNGAGARVQISPAILSLCRNATTDAGWPPLLS